MKSEIRSVVAREVAWAWIHPLICLLLTVSMISTAVARQAPGSSADGLTLPLAVDIALKTNPLIRETSAGRDLADSHISEARAGRAPLLQFSETFTRGNNPVFVFGSLLEQGRFGPENFAVSSLNNPDALSNFRTALTFRLPVFDQHQTSTRINQAELGRRQADARTEMAEQHVRFEVLKAFYGLLIALSRKNVADEAVEMAASDVKRIRDMHDAGMIVASDLLAAEVQHAEFLQQQIQAEGDIVVARAALNTVLGIAIDAPQPIAGQLIERIFDPGSQEDLIRLAMVNRPEVRDARLSLQSAEQGVRSARSELLPRIDVFGTYGMSGQGLASGSADYTIGASLTFNIFDAGRRARLERAQAVESVAAAGQERIASQIRFEVVRALQNFISARERLKVASRAVAQATEALRIVQDRYNAGLTTITEVLRAETALVRARTALIAARYEQYIGYASVLLASGTLRDVERFVS